MNNTLRQTAIATLLTLIALGASASGTHADTHAGGHDAASAIGKPGVAAKVTRTIQVDMNDAMRFTPAEIDVRQGETVRFVVRNVGKIKHELVLGSVKALEAHHELMKKNPGMAHDEPGMVTLASGRTGKLVWQFTQAGKVDFACLQPGHYDAGMKGAVFVAQTTRK